MFNKRCENRENSRNEQLFSLILGIVEFYLYRGAGIIRKIGNKKTAPMLFGAVSHICSRNYFSPSTYFLTAILSPSYSTYVNSEIQSPRMMQRAVSVSITSASQWR